MKVRIIILLSILAIISWTPNGFAAETSLANKPCSKIGTKKLEGLATYICQQSGKTKKWIKLIASTPTPSPSPTTTLLYSVGLLKVTPIVSLESVSQYRTQYVNIFVQSPLDNPDTTLGLFIEAPNNFADVVGCSSGKEPLGQDPFFNGKPIRESRDSELILSGSRVRGFLIPTVPINIRCNLRVAPHYKFWVYTFSKNRNERSFLISETTLIQNPDYVSPTPTPSPTPTYQSQPVIGLGQPCSPEGASVIASDGNRYVCRKSQNNSNLGWNK